MNSILVIANGESDFFSLLTKHCNITLTGFEFPAPIDVDARENCGMPHDKGRGPHCIESGWTVGEILIGLQFMTASNRFNKKA